jgi:hypothetical protein
MCGADKGEGMSSYAYQEILEKVLQLPSEEKLKLIEAILADLRRTHEIGKEPPRNIMDYEGFAKDLWKGIDVQEYLNEERNSWDREDEGNIPVHPVKEDSRKLHSILEFKGLGKEIWEGIDAQDYVNEERTWDR